METKPSKADRRRLGEKKRKHVSRKEQGTWKHKKVDRSAFQLLEAVASDRIPHLLDLKYQRMIESPFAYFRGAAPVMAHDLAHQPHAGIFNQLCGDAHLRNLGAYAGIDGRLVFDINDFDETICGPFEWDVKRLATSVHLSAREIGESEDDCRDAVRALLHRYRKSVELFAELPVLELGRFQVRRESDLQAITDVFAKAERSTAVHLRDKLTDEVDPKRKPKSGKKKRDVLTRRTFKTQPPELERLKPEEARLVEDCIPVYMQTIEPERQHLLRRYRAVDFAFKVVGTGSVGLRDYCVYFEGNGLNDPLFLQIKQEVESAWTPYLPPDLPKQPAVSHHGQRVVIGQRAMQIQSDPFLGFTTIDGRDYLVRQLSDHKGSVNLGALDAETLAQYADLCGELLARGHARSGDPDGLAGYIGKGSSFDKAIADFARNYADQTERDWKELKRLHAA